LLIAASEAEKQRNRSKKDEGREGKRKRGGRNGNGR
jgi:hypothetical protein